MPSTSAVPTPAAATSSEPTQSPPTRSSAVSSGGRAGAGGTVGRRGRGHRTVRSRGARRRRGRVARRRVRRAAGRPRRRWGAGGGSARRWGGGGGGGGGRAAAAGSWLRGAPHRPQKAAPACAACAAAGAELVRHRRLPLPRPAPFVAPGSSRGQGATPGASRTAVHAGPPVGMMADVSDAQGAPDAAVGAVPAGDDQAALRPYVPRLVVDWLRTTPQTRVREVSGSLAFVDISGFTALTERLARKGRVGAEEMSDTLSAVFSGLLRDRVRGRRRPGQVGRRRGPAAVRG